MRPRTVLLVTALLAAAISVVAESGQTDGLSVPSSLQIGLLGRAVRFERRTMPAVVVVVVAKQGMEASVRAAAQAGAAIGLSGSTGLAARRCRASLTYIHNAYLPYSVVPFETQAPGEARLSVSVVTRLQRFWDCNTTMLADLRFEKTC
jgi:hypothetical protein